MLPVILGGQFVEITHEFLINPIRKEVARELYSDLALPKT
jgi:hypothetical protein